MRRYWKKGGGWRFRRASQVRTGRGRLDVALDRAEAASDDVCQVLILGLPEGPLLAGVEVYGKRIRICGRAGRVTVAPSVPWRLIEAVRKADGVDKPPGKV
jgi:hypothetical protein